MKEYKYTIFNPIGFNETQVQNGTLYGLESILKLGEDWWANQKSVAQRAIANGELFFYTNHMDYDYFTSSLIWSTEEAKTTYDNDINISLIIDRLNELGYNISVSIEDV